VDVRAWAIARGLAAIMRTHYSTRYWSLVILLLALLLGPVLNVLFRFPEMNLRNDHTVSEYAAAVLRAAPQAIIITENDGQTFALWYYRHVAGQRLDLAVVDRRWQATVVCSLLRARFRATIAGR
jgi:hypothetical protein